MGDEMRFGKIRERLHASATSDVDLLVEFDKGRKDFFNYMRLKLYLEQKLERRVDPVLKGAIKPRPRETIPLYSLATSHLHYI